MCQSVSFRPLLLVLCLALAVVPLRGFAVTLKVPEALDLLSVNAKQQKRFLFKHQATLELIAGENHLVFRYRDFWGDDDDFDKVQSQPFLVSFTAMEAQHYTLRLPELKDAEAAQRFSQSPAVSIVNNANEAAVAVRIFPNLDTQAHQLLMAEVFRPQQRAAELQEAGMATDQAQSSQPKPVKPLMNGQEDVLQQLHYYWQQASDEQKQVFLRSIL